MGCFPWSQVFGLTSDTSIFLGHRGRARHKHSLKKLKKAGSRLVAMHEAIEAQPRKPPPPKGAAKPKCISRRTCGQRGPKKGRKRRQAQAVGRAPPRRVRSTYRGGALNYATLGFYKPNPNAPISPPEPPSPINISIPRSKKIQNPNPPLPFQRKKRVF